jgi:hypothetical protein
MLFGRKKAESKSESEDVAPRRRLTRKERKRRLESTRFVRDNPHLLSMKPRERYVFHSDYFEVDDYFACVMAFFHREGAPDGFAPFWGMNRVVSGLPDGVTICLFEQVARMSDAWVARHQTAAENVAAHNEVEQYSGGSMTNKEKSTRSIADLETIAVELNGGASYLSVHNRILVKAPSLSVLEDAVAKIERWYMDNLGTVWAAPRVGRQKRELSDLFVKNVKKIGKPSGYYTSTEFAGSYSLVTHGLEDPTGEYVGCMDGDVNNSAVILDVNRFKHSVVIATEQIDESRGRARVSDMWGSKLGQACMIDNVRDTTSPTGLRGGRVVHLLMDEVDFGRLGPAFEGLTSHVDLNRGDVNPFELFGSTDDELALFSQQLEKLKLMIEQTQAPDPRDRDIMRGMLQKVATKYYISRGMWVNDAMNNRDKLRIVGIPHDEVPHLSLFCMYLAKELRAAERAEASNPDTLRALTALQTAFDNLLSANGDLFNVTTNPVIDSVVGGRRVIYDFSSLMRRGKGVAMAQLVNVIGFAIGNLGRGDLVVIHGAENIDVDIRDYVDTQFNQLWRVGGRVAYCYGSVEAMLADQEFNRFDKADYTILGSMSRNTMLDYQQRLGQRIPDDLENLITDASRQLCFCRRGLDNVVFAQELMLDPAVDAVSRRKVAMS